MDKCSLEMKRAAIPAALFVPRAGVLLYAYYQYITKFPS